MLQFFDPHAEKYFSSSRSTVLGQRCTESVQPCLSKSPHVHSICMSPSTLERPFQNPNITSEIDIRLDSPYHPYAMSLSKPWNHFGPHQLFSGKQNLDHYRDALSSSILAPAFSCAFSPLSNMNALSAEEMERFQRLSDTYQPNLEVAFISPSARNKPLTSIESSRLNEKAQPHYRTGICQCRSHSRSKDKCKLLWLTLCPPKGVPYLTRYRRLLFHTLNVVS